MISMTKYIDPTTWELVTETNGVETNRTSNPAKIIAHLRSYDGC